MKMLTDGTVRKDFADKAVASLQNGTAAQAETTASIRAAQIASSDATYL